MKTSISIYDFRQAFQDMGRIDQFSRKGLDCLFEWLEEYEESTGSEIELDVIAICCDFTESNWSDIAADYRINLENCEEEDEKIDAVKEYLGKNTSVIGETDDGVFVYQNF